MVRCQELGRQGRNGIGLRAALEYDGARIISRLANHERMHSSSSGPYHGTDEDGI